MKYVLAELKLNNVRYIKNLKEVQYTYRLATAQRFTYSEARKYAGALQHLGFDFMAMDSDIAAKIEEVWHG